MTPRMTPADRSTRVSDRVSMSAIATMPLRFRYPGRSDSARNLLEDPDVKKAYLGG